ncbi:MAG TPA: RbsD/FucU domain-containing protein [Tepidisphaeraceae bacterium]|nr:RbsD/FucU domain-containing protein [Tepidisphaeraceae bacterium]
MRITISLFAVLLCALIGGCGGGIGPVMTPIATDADNANQTYQQKVLSTLPEYGHRNWIVIADSAYPAQSRAGIQTVVTNSDQLKVLRTVLDDIKKMPHVTPIVYTDAELKYVPEKDAPGIDKYRKDLANVLGNRPVQSLPHEQIIAKLDEAGKTFKILILKTNLTIPYTSVFLQLDCAYWGPDAEKRLRETMQEEK